MVKWIVEAPVHGNVRALTNIVVTERTVESIGFS